MEPEASGDVGYWPKVTMSDMDLDFFSAVHPDDVSDLRALLKTATQDGTRFTTDYRVVCKDETVLRIKACGGQFMNSDGSISLVGTCVNITNLKQLREADLKQMLHEQALCGTAARCGTSCSAIRIAAFPDSTDILPWTLGDCFAQVSGFAQPAFLAVVVAHCSGGVLCPAGSFGQVHNGLRQSQGGNFAVKVLSLCTENGNDPSVCKPLTHALQEAFIMRRLKHPNIVQYLGSEVKGYELFVMQEKVQ
eukprot:21409-Heterococcus_DN1.PRE.3